jgi:hypothetical protein
MTLSLLASFNTSSSNLALPHPAMQTSTSLILSFNSPGLKLFEVSFHLTSPIDSNFFTTREGKKPSLTPEFS